MAYAAYLCHNRDSAHEVESRKNVILGPRAATVYRARRAPPRLARLVPTHLVIREPLCHATRIEPGSALRYQ